MSNAERVIFPQIGLSKGELVRYYETVAETMLPFVVDRPVTLQRFPKGLAGPGFMQKNASGHFPDSIGRFEVQKTGGGTTVYPVITQADHIPYLANQGAITFHIWTSRLPDDHLADAMVLDLDPTEGENEMVRTVALAVAAVLAEFAIGSIPVATGSKGFHIWIPTIPTGWELMTAASRALAGIIALKHPELATTEFLKRNRRGRVFIDWLRNHQGSTVVSPLSVRPRPTAPVAMPIKWAELPSTEPAGWTVSNVGTRLASLPKWPAPAELPHDQIIKTAIELGVDMEAVFDRFGR